MNIRLESKNMNGYGRTLGIVGRHFFAPCSTGLLRHIKEAQDNINCMTTVMPSHVDF